MALSGAVIFAIAGLVIGVRKAAMLRLRLEEIHARREELRREMERRAGGAAHFVDKPSQPTSDGRMP
jgi:hypothetical protein